MINPNTVAKAYRELEHDGVIELRQGTGAFVSGNGRSGRVARVKFAQPVLQAALERLTAAGLAPEEIRRLFEAELQRVAERPRTRKS